MVDRSYSQQTIPSRCFLEGELRKRIQTTFKQSFTGGKLHPWQQTSKSVFGPFVLLGETRCPCGTPVSHLYSWINKLLQANQHKLLTLVFQGPFTLSVSQLKLILIKAINATSVAETDLFIFFYRKNYQCIMIIWEKAWWGAGTTTLPCDCKQERLWFKNDALVVFGGKM